jgi:hypothetical protein
VNPVNRIDFGCGKIRYDVDAVKQVAREFFEVFDFADFFHLINNAIQHGLDFFVGLFLEERTLAFQAAFVPKELFLVKIRDLFFSSLWYFHEGRNITPHRVSLQASF